MMKKIRYCFLVVLLLHLLLLMSFSVGLVFPESPQTPEADRETKADRILPSYVQAEDVNSQQSNPLQANPANEASVKPKSETDPTGILKPEKPVTKATTTPSPTNSPASQDRKAGGAPHMDPANLIADKETDKPLIKLLSRATGAQLFYPKSAQDFHITGLVRIKFYITPAGIVSNVTMLQSSGHKQLDDAALYAITHISPVSGVDKYLPAPRFLTVGIMFEG